MPGQYEHVHDFINAEKYYKEDLLHDPEHSTVEADLYFFNEHNMTLPQIEEKLEDLLMEEKFDELEFVFEKSLNNKVMNEDG